MAEAVLITLNDLQAYRQIDAKFNTARFNSFAQETQRKNLRNLLGDELFYEFMEDDRTSGVYEKLLNGEAYQVNGKTIQYYGIKPALCYWWLSLAAKEGDLFMATYGAVKFANNPQQHFESAKEKNKVSADYSETAQYYANDIIKYLNNNSTNYPLWTRDVEKSPKSFISFRL